MNAPTPLQARVAREIIWIARRENKKSGERLPESVLAKQLGVSRTPVNLALRHLEKLGALERDMNRGYFLTRDAEDCLTLLDELFSKPDEPLYLRIAEERLDGKLPTKFLETDLMRRYEVTRASLRNVLSRIRQEGWVERQLGMGWQFTALIDSPEAYEESHAFRATIEPAGLLSPTFRFRMEELVKLQNRQRYIAEKGCESMTSIELYEANAEFHETISKWSGNRFFMQSVRRINSLRRLVEYRQASQREPRREAAIEHLKILEAIAAQDMISATHLLKTHIERARRIKVYGAPGFAMRCD